MPRYRTWNRRVRLRVSQGAVLRCTAIGLTVLAHPLAAQGGADAPCDFSRVPGVIWWGTETAMPLTRLVAYAAPIYWFSPDEPLLEGRRGADIRIPEVITGEPPADGPVVYYQVNRILARPGAPGIAFTRDTTDPGRGSIDLASVGAISMIYVAYFSQETGLGAHRHDTETTEFRIIVVPSTWEKFDQFPGTECAQPNWVVIVARVSAKAHGLVWFWNVIETREDEAVKFPMHLLVEEGKHGIGTDKNGDGYFTPGYDVNVRVNDAWGVRDNLRTGLLVSGSYAPWMTKVRRPEHRVFPPLPDDSPLRDALTEIIAGEPHAVYELRPYPSASIAGEDQGLAHMIKNHEEPGWPDVGELNDTRQWTKWVTDGAALKSLSIAARADGTTIGLSWVFPFFVVKHLEDPAAGGYIVQRMYFTDVGWRDFGWMAMYTPSASRWLDSYLAAGGEYDVEADSLGTETGKWDFVFETGLKFRVNVEHTPLKVLSFFTPYWGFRAGIKNRGFFNVNRLTYVLEFGAGSF